MMKAHHIDQQQLRKTGRPYYHHPLEVAAMTLRALTALEVDGHLINDAFKQKCVFEALVHDITEDQAHPHKRGDSDYKPLFSPLTVHYVHQLADNPWADSAAETTRLLEHANFKKEPWAENREQYIARGIVGLGWRLIKSADMTHNLQEPKPVTVPKQQVKWSQAKTNYKHALELIWETARSGDAPNWEPLYHEYVAANGTSGGMEQIVDELYDYMGVRKDWLVLAA